MYGTTTKIALFIFYIRKLCYVTTMSKLDGRINGNVAKSNLR
jgi:hypothetical protein